MYLRFQGRVPNLGTASMLGIFQLAIELRDRHDAPTYVTNELNRHLSWFNAHLDAPEVLDDDTHYRAICWFKPAATEPLHRIWSMKAMLQEFGYPIDLVKAKSPGRIIFEDDWQVVAKPKRR